MKELKVGDSFEVIEVTKSKSVYYKKGDFGVCVRKLTRGICAIIGSQERDNTGWYIENDEFKKVGKLTITKLKK